MRRRYFTTTIASRSTSVHGHVHLHGARSKHKIGLALKDMGKRVEAKDLFTQRLVYAGCCDNAQLLWCSPRADYRV